MRKAHETRQAKKGVRTMHDDPTSRANLKDTKRKLIIRRLHQVLKEAQDDVAIGTGFERKGRWQARVSAKGGQTGTEELVANGNVANAIAAATTQSAKVLALSFMYDLFSQFPALTLGFCKASSDFSSLQGTSFGMSVCSSCYLNQAARSG